VRKEELAKFFEDKDCRVDQIRLLTDKEGRLRGYGYVEFLDEESLRLALECHDQDFLGRAIRVGIAERRKEAGFTSRRDSREGYSRRDNSDTDEAKTWRSQRLAHAPVSDPLHADQDNKADEHLSPQPVKPKSNPFGDAKPRDEREAERKLTELQKQREEEEKKRKEEERRKREEEALKKKQEKESQGQKEAGHQGDQKSATTWRAEKDHDGKPSSGWASNKKRNEASRGTEGRRDPKKTSGAPRNPGRKPESAVRGDRKVLSGGRGRGKPQTEAKEKASSPQEQKEPKKQIAREDRPKTETTKAANAPSSAPALENDNAFALLREDEEA